MSNTIGVSKIKVFKEFVMTLLASTQVFHQSKLICFFFIFDVFFLDVSYILHSYRSQGIFLLEQMNLFNYFFLHFISLLVS